MNKFQCQMQFHGKIPHLHGIGDIRQNLSISLAKTLRRCQIYAVGPSPFIESFLSSSLLWYILFSINMSESSKNQEPFGATNIKVYVPLILDLNQLNYDSWKELFQTHCSNFGVKGHLTETPNQQITRMRHGFILMA